MSFFAYHRVSTTTQKLDRGLDEIERFCKERGIVLKSPTYTDKQSGKTFDRPRYTVLKEDILREGDTLIITEVDRLGRNKAQIVQELNDFKAMGVRVMILELPTTLMDVTTDSSLNKLILETIQTMIIELYACLAQGELEKKNLRQAQGLEAMKRRGDWDRYGRPKKCEWVEFVAVYEQVLRGQMKPSVATEKLGMSKPTYYRYKKKYEKEMIL